MVALDTDVLVLAFAFHHDARQAVNAAFLQTVRQNEPAVPIFVVMELLGQLSFNMSATHLAEWRLWLRDEYGLRVLAPSWNDSTSVERFFQDTFVDRPLTRMRYRMPYMDALILDVIEEIPHLTAFVSWNARHYRHATQVSVLTPVEYLAAQSP